MKQLATEAAEIMNQVRTDQTQESYVSSLRHWVNFNLEYQEDPFEFPIDPYKAMFWIQSRFKESGNIKSIKTWKAMLNWISCTAGYEPSYKQNPDYIRYIKALNKLYNQGNDHRLPFTIKHIAVYVRSLLKNQTLTFQNLTKATLATLYFCSMSRPCELVRSTTDQARLKGIRIRNFSKMFDKENKTPIIRLEVEAYKNQTSRLITKLIYLSSTTCKHSDKCMCKYVNPYKLLTRLMTMRDQMIIEMEHQLKSYTLTAKQRKNLSQKLSAFKWKSDNHLFIHPSGKSIATTYITEIAKEIVKVNGIMNSQNYTAYSFRIGGTTRAAAAKIDHPVILKYVGWSSSRLADCAQRYMRFAPVELARVPFDLIHPKTKIIKSPKIYDPWSERLNERYFK